MATTVNGAFTEFMRDTVNLDKDQTQIAQRSRDNLLSNIKSFSGDSDFFSINGTRSLFFGSFARHTKLRPLDDIDLKSNNNINNTNTSNIPSNQILSTEGAQVQSGCDEDEMRGVRAYAEIISENLELEVLKQNYKYDVELLDGIYDLILEVVVSKSPTTVIASNEYPTELVRSKFLKLTSMHVEYVMDCFNQNSTKVRNIKKYLLAALFNAPSTISGYYTAEVHHDMPYLAAR